MIDLAVAFVLGAAFNGAVQSLVKDLVTPLLAAIGGKPNFANLYFTFNHSKFMYGDFVDAVLSFIIMACVIFFLLVKPINKIIAIANSRKTPETPTDKKCPECLSVIPKDATRCAYCGVKLSAAKAK